MLRRLGSLIIACILLCTVSVRAETLSVQVIVRGQQTTVSVDLQTPSGVGPFPVVILLPGCAALEDTGLPVWLGLFHQWGFATVRWEGLALRGYTDVCGDDVLMGQFAREQLNDIYQLASALAVSKSFKAGSLAVFGRSLGSNTVVNYLATDTGNGREGKVAVGVGLFPTCSTSNRIVMPLLILTGALDDWNYAQRCVDLARFNSAAVQIKVYPNAYHGFDRVGAPVTFRGHHIEYNATATQDAYSTTRAFLGRLLQ